MYGLLYSEVRSGRFGLLKPVKQQNNVRIPGMV